MLRCVTTVDDSIDTATIDELSQEIRDLNNDDFIVIFENIPPIKDLIKIIPRSLPLLDAIYQKCEKVNLCYTDIFRRYLDCDQLLNRILWWYAITNQIPKVPGLPDIKVENHANLHNAMITESQKQMTPEDHIKSILGIIQRKNPEMIEEIFLEKSQLFSCLEALGCHGLINCNTGMVHLIEAVLYETIKLQEKIKAILTKIKEMQKQKFLKDSPTKASHQRQLSLKLSEIYDRLKQNEAIETVIIEIVTNPRLESLLRIVRKRVHADRTLINVFNSYNNTKPDGFEICEVNPIVAKLIVIFQNAYKHLTSMIPISDENVCGDNNDNINDDDEIVEDNCNDDTVSDRSLMDNKEALSENSSICVSASFHGQSNNHSNGIASTNPRWITLSIYSSPEEIQQLLDRFTNLYYHQKDEILKTLNGLKEFKGLKDLQIKTMLSVIVLTYRSVFDATQLQYKQIYKTLEMDAEFDDLMNYSIYRNMYRQAKNNHGIKNAKDVTSQIWETLFDFPSLKTCTRFNRFILDCVDVIWDIVAGIDGRMPRMRLDFECHGISFDPTRHIRSPEASMDSKAIKFCIWPGLINCHDNQHVIKAIMCT